MVRVEGLLNSRPLTETPIDPSSMEVLTPNHFVIGRVSQPILPNVVDSTKYLSYKRVQNMANQSMKRWAKEYLPVLTKRNKWNREAEPLNEEDSFLVDRSQSQLNWPLVRVSKLYPGKDGNARVAEIITTSGSKKRTGVVSIARLNIRSTFSTAAPEDSSGAVDGRGHVGDTTEAANTHSAHATATSRLSPN